MSPGQVDALDEFNETYAVTLSNPVNGAIGDGTGKGTIIDDDPLARLSVNDKSTVEGNSGTKTLTLKVWLDAPSGKKVKVTVSTADGSPPPRRATTPASSRPSRSALARPSSSWE